MAVTETARSGSTAGSKATRAPKLKKVFICSPFSPVGDTRDERSRDLDRNIRRAQKACRYAALKGFIPYAPHLYFTQFLNDSDAFEREYGLTMGLTWLARCDELWVIGRNVSKGMEKEIRMAGEWGIPVRNYVSRRTAEERLLDMINSPGKKFYEMT